MRGKMRVYMMQVLWKAKYGKVPMAVTFGEKVS